MDDDQNILKYYLSHTNYFIESSIDYKEALYVFLGAPFDLTSTFRSGSKYFPSSVREASKNIEGYSFRCGYDIKDARIHDAGDINAFSNISKIVDVIEKVYTRIIIDGKKPIMVGGEHTITLGASRALDDDVAIMVFDAHFDLRNEYLGEKISHATVLRRILDERGPEKITHLGVRATYREELDHVKKSNLKYYSTNFLKKNMDDAVTSVKAFLSSFKGIYLSIDMDVFDPSFAPAVGNPETEGISPTILFDILNNLGKVNIIGFDITEGSPILPDCGITSILAAKTIFEIISCAENQ